MKQLLVLGGPTASGKSALAMVAAEFLAAKGLQPEILCADSVTIYRGFSLGAAKPTDADRARVPHHLLDLKDASEPFTAGDFFREADALLQKLLAEGKFPILVGGTGFYLRALLRGMATEEEDQEKAAAIKSRLETRGREEGWDKLYSELLAKDPDCRRTVHGNDHYRIVRALQAMELQGRTWSEANRAARETPPRYDAHYFKLRIERAELKARIEARSRRMLDHGLVAEVEGLLSRGIQAQAKPMQSIGYKEVLEWKAGLFPKDELCQRIVQSTLRLAKAQSTWFRSEELGQWLDPPFVESLLAHLR